MVEDGQLLTIKKLKNKNLIILEMLCQLSLKVKNAADGTHISFEGHCAMTNAEEGSK